MRAAMSNIAPDSALAEMFVEWRRRVPEKPRSPNTSVSERIVRAFDTPNVVRPEKRMLTENPHDPQPDELPEDQRTGDEPHPAGKTKIPENAVPQP
jgi:hypothetical protein